MDDFNRSDAAKGVLRFAKMAGPLDLLNTCTSDAEILMDGSYPMSEGIRHHALTTGEPNTCNVVTVTVVV